MVDEIKIGLIGAGKNTRNKHIPRLLEIPGVSVEVVCNRSPESSQQVADEFGIPRIAKSWTDVIADPEVDAVVIGTWPNMHAPISLAALEAGKHVLCEARMAMNLPEAQAMLNASTAHPDQIAQVVPSPFTLHWDRFIKQQLDKGLIGELIAVDVFATDGTFVNFDREMTWRDDINLSGLNTMGLGIFYEAMARWVGHASTVKAQGRIQIKTRNGQSLHIPDHLDVFGDLENGASYHIRSSQLTGACPTSKNFILYGSKGTLRLDLQKKELTLDTPDQPTQLLTVPESEQESWRVEAEFIGAIRKEETVRLTTFEEGLRYMDFTQKVADELQLAPSEFRKP